MLELYEYFDEVLIFSDPAPPYLYYSFRKNLGESYRRPIRSTKKERGEKLAWRWFVHFQGGTASGPSHFSPAYSN